jgi:hypothetical protein
MAWECCKNGRRNGGKEVTGRQTKRKEKERKTFSNWTNDVGLDLRNMQ